MKKILGILLVVLFFSACQTKKVETIKIGAILPLTGDVAVYGNNTKKGIDLAVKEINSNGGINGNLIKIIYEDSKADPKTGVTAIQKLISHDNIQVVIDNSISSVALAMVPIAERNKIVLLSTGSTNPKLSGISPYFFRIWNSDAFEGKLCAEYAYNKLGYTKYSILYVNNDYGVSLEKVFKNEIEQLGGEIIVSKSFQQNSIDFKTQLLKIKMAKTQAIYLVGYSKEISRVLLQIKELEITEQIIGTVTVEDQQIIEIAKDAAEGVIYPFPEEPDPKKPIAAEFKKSYKEEYHEKPAITCDVGYDAVFLIKKAIEARNKYSGTAIKEGLKSIQDYCGASGIITFDKNGDVSKPMIFKTIKKGNFINMK